MLAAAVAAAAAATAPSQWAYSCSAGLNVSTYAHSIGLNLTGRVIVVTGADGREGYQLAKTVGLAGATIVGLSRDDDVAAATKKRLEADLQGKGVVDTLGMDLSSFASVKSGAATLLQRHPTIDVLANVAAAAIDGHTADGYVLTVQVSHISAALLTNLLLPALKRSSAPRVVNIGSAAGYDDLSLPSPNGGLDTIMGWCKDGRSGEDSHYYYALSKYLIVHYTAAQAVRMPEVASFSVNPGFFRDDPSKYKDQCKPQLLFEPCPQYPAQGATSTLFAMVQPGIESATGSLFDFDTTIKAGASPPWVQSGDSCIPRPLPLPWNSTTGLQWYDMVQKALADA
eukprot:TRINITY_DN383_c0_g1_i1.p1 TRINITY_DN383_c0_g1~~TRINITY_DN383_c0_g1_i1.p1  ORF type:complete len:361 (+),score=145.60 TRINITY_DN383_c0_g1_i1:62-1084(+)